MPAVSAIYSAAGKEYVITDDDALWLARMVVGEGGRNASDEKIRALLWAIMNRFLLHPGQRNRSTLKSILQAFSQPINPRWDGVDEGDDDFCAPGGKYYGTEYCSQARLNRRKEIMSLSWSSIPKRIQQAVDQFRSGELPQPEITAKLAAQGKPSKINNWASYPSVREKFPWGGDVEGDWFFEDKGTLNTLISINGVVERIKAPGFVSLGLLPGMAIGAVLGTLGYFLMRRFM